MLEIVVKLLEQTLGKLIGKSIDLSVKSLEKKRTLLNSLLSLHEALAELENESHKTYEAFKRWAQKRSVTNVVLKSRLEALRKNLKKFDEHLLVIGHILEIYDLELTLELYGFRHGKAFNLERIDLLLTLLPKQIKENDKFTTKIYYPSCIPDLTKIKTNYPTFMAKTLKKQMTETTAVIENRSERRILDLSNGPQLLKVLDKEKEIIERLEKIRMELATFIKDNVPIEKVLTP